MTEMDEARLSAIAPTAPHATDDPAFVAAILVFRSFYALCEFYGLQMVQGENEYGAAKVAFLNLTWRDKVYPSFAECDDPGLVDSFVLFCRKEHLTEFPAVAIEFFNLRHFDYMLFDERGEWVT